MLHGSFSPEVVGESLQKERWDNNARKCSVLVKMNLAFRTLTKRGTLLFWASVNDWWDSYASGTCSVSQIQQLSQQEQGHLCCFTSSGTQTPSLRVSPPPGHTCRHQTFLLCRLMASPPEPIFRETVSLTGSPLEPLIPALPGSPWKRQKGKKKSKKKKQCQKQSSS